MRIKLSNDGHLFIEITLQMFHNDVTLLLLKTHKFLATGITPNTSRQEASLKGM
jgi:hypothetical protein